MERRHFLAQALAGGAALGTGLDGAINAKSVLADPRRKAVVVQEKGKYDILLKGGHVIDPASNISDLMDVAIAEGKIAVVGKNVPATDAKRTIDVSGLYVSPGLIDIHVHCFYTHTPFYYLLRWIVADDMCLPAGVTTCVDAGCAGVDNFPQFVEVIRKSKMRILAFINISAPGMDMNEHDPLTFKIPPLMAGREGMVAKYPGLIVGIKTAHYGPRVPYDNIHTPWASVDAAVEAGRRNNLPVMFDFSSRPAQGTWPARTCSELILEHGRPGDIHTHFLGKSEYIDKNGKVIPDLAKAQEKGFIFDVGHGSGSFRWEVAIPFIEQGFKPNSISTDLHSNSTIGSAVSMPNVMSKFLCIGMSLEDVIRCSTINPAKEINRPELGSLKVGNTADVAVFEVVNGQFDYRDAGAGKIYGDKKIQNLMTLFGGELLFDPWGLNSVFWKDVPRRTRNEGADPSDDENADQLRAL
jgi:dihydroorotase